MENTKVEEQVTSTEPVKEEVPQEPIPTEETPAEETKVDPAELQEKNRQLYERAKKAETEAKELKTKLKDLEESPSENFFEGDEQVSTLTKRLSALEEKTELDSLYGKYPVLKDKYDEFNDFREEYPKHKLENVAKLFLVESGILGGEQPRQGLERPTGGAKTPPSTGKMTTEDVARLRTTNYEAYRKLLREGKVQISD